MREGVWKSEEWRVKSEKRRLKGEGKRERTQSSLFGCFWRGYDSRQGVVERLAQFHHAPREFERPLRQITPRSPLISLFTLHSSLFISPFTKSKPLSQTPPGSPAPGGPRRSFPSAGPDRRPGAVFLLPRAGRPRVARPDCPWSSRGWRGA